MGTLDLSLWKVHATSLAFALQSLQILGSCLVRYVVLLVLQLNLWPLHALGQKYVSCDEVPIISPLLQ